MLSTKQRLQLEFICKRISEGADVELQEMIWADKLAKVNRSAYEMLRKARRAATTKDAPEGGLDSFLNSMDLGDPDPSQHSTGFDSADEIVEWFSRDDKTDDWLTRD